MGSNTTIDEPVPVAAPSDQPVGGSERIVTLDFIRGIAVLGILVANIVAMSYPLLAYHWPEAMGHEPDVSDRAVWLAQYVVIDGKMRGLFTLLFGAGMILFLERARARGQGGLLQARRLFWLMLFGLVHFFVLFWGDILFLYAIAGIIALAMVKWPAKRQLGIGIAWYLAGSILFAGSQAPLLIFEQSEAARIVSPEAYESTIEYWEGSLAAAEDERDAFTKGSYPTELAYVANDRSLVLTFYPVLALFETIPLMLIGMGLYRIGLFSGGLDPGRQRKWGWIGVLAGGAIALAMGWQAVSNQFPPLLTDFVFNGGAQGPRLPMILGLAALLALWAPAAAKGWLGQRIAAAGRMAFSNYIGTSLLVMLVMRHWAGGLWGELDRIELLVVVLGVWLLILAWSQPWLERYRYGPLEWLWRCLTYWRLFPMRR
jgi:uncharacterized protein